MEEVDVGFSVEESARPFLHIRCSRQKEPICMHTVILNILSVPESEEAWKSLTRSLDNAMILVREKKLTYCMMLDASGIQFISPDKAASFHAIIGRKYMDVIRNQLVATAIVCDSPALRTVANAIFELLPTTRPLRFYSTQDAGVHQSILLFFATEAATLRDNRLLGK
jgi:hypothetical protein